MTNTCLSVTLWRVSPHHVNLQAHAAKQKEEAMREKAAALAKEKNEAAQKKAAALAKEKEEAAQKVDTPAPHFKRKPSVLHLAQCA